MHFGVIFGDHPEAFPYFQLARMTAPNLVAGNVVVVKHDGSIPPSALAFERLWQEAGAPAGIFTNLLVSPAQANRLLGNPRMRFASSGGAEAIQRINRTTGGESQVRHG
jgi:succinate-semialdehyde dehydrogenase/glutarate-semialdehyde dehydrogenase